MYQLKHQRYWLALLTAILLFMQSFAVWHDAEHAFHHVDEQCERFEAFTNNSTLDTFNVISLSPVSRLTLETTFIETAHVNTKAHDAYTIRAPPSLLS